MRDFLGAASKKFKNWELEMNSDPYVHVIPWVLVKNISSRPNVKIWKWLARKSIGRGGAKLFFRPNFGRLMYSPGSLNFQLGSLGKFIFRPDFGKNRFHCNCVEANFLCGYLENGLSLFGQGLKTYVLVQKKLTNSKF